MGILIAGVGNELKGDDGFGVRAARMAGLDPRVKNRATTIETGIGGIHLVQELMRGYDTLILFDACDRGAQPGRLFLLVPDLPDIEALTDRERRDFFADVHYATPIRALTLARAIGALPPRVRIIGCQVAEADTFGTEMSEVVAAAIPPAIDMALEVLAAISAETAIP